MWIIISTLHLLACVLLIILILLQQGKGADAGASFGGGNSSSVFGPMIENPLKNITTVVAIIFMITSVSLAYRARFAQEQDSGLFSRESQKVVSESSNVELGADDVKTDQPLDSSATSPEVVQ